MNENSKKENEKPRAGTVSRRGFLGGAGAGVLTSVIVSQVTLAENAPKAEAPSEIALTVNNRRHSLVVEPRWTLLYVLREKLSLTGTKEGCARGECGACTVLIDGEPRYACQTLALEAEDHEITTVEGLLQGEELRPVQKAFVKEDGFQCGYCTSGQIMAAEGLLRRNPDPTTEEIQDAMSGNLCRCGAYDHIFKSVKTAAALKKGSTA